MARQGRAVTVGLTAALCLGIAFLYVPDVRCQNTESFAPYYEFTIPNSHNYVRFAFNVTCSSATLNGMTWQFDDLSLNGSQRSGSLKVTAENSNITIFSYRTGNAFLRSARLTYFAEGDGAQTFNLFLNNTQPTHPSEWSVIVPDSVFLAEGEGWRLLPDDSIQLEDLVGSITLVHYSFQAPTASDQPFYIQHSVGLATAAALVATLAAALIIKFRGRR